MFTHNDLVNIAEKWLLQRCGFAFKELSTDAFEIPDVIGFKSTHTILIECKVSRNDFLNDYKKIFRLSSYLGVGTFRYFMCPKDLIKVEELPNKWGLLYVNDKAQVRQRVGPKGNTTYKNKEWIFNKNIINEQRLMYSALRRLQLQGVMPLIYQKYRNNYENKFMKDYKKIYYKI